MSIPGKVELPACEAARFVITFRLIHGAFGYLTLPGVGPLLSGKYCLYQGICLNAFVYQHICYVSSVPAGILVTSQ